MEVKLTRSKTPKELASEMLIPVLEGISKFPDLVSTYQRTTMEEDGDHFNVVIHTYRIRIHFSFSLEDLPSNKLIQAWKEAENNSLFKWLDPEETSKWKEFINHLTLAQDDTI